MQQEQNNIKQLLDEVKADAEKLYGWDELKVLSISKYGVEAVIKTDKGNIKMSMRELFTQYYFILKVFETFGISLMKVKDIIYEKWRTEWSKTIVDMGGEYGTSLELLGESLETYIESAEERDEAYLRKGEPIIIHDGSVAFKSNEFQNWLKRKNIIYTNDQLHVVLRDLGCNPKQYGKSRMRIWTYRPKELKEETLFSNEEQK